MDRIASHERLLEALRQRIFVPLDVVIPLRFRRAPYEDRSTAAIEPRHNWTPVNSDLVWGEPSGYFWFGGTVTMPAEALGRRVFCRIDAQFGSVMGRSDPQCLVRVNGRIAQGADGNHREFLLTSNAVAGQSFDILIEAGTIEDRRQLGFACSLVLHDALAEKLYYDLKVPLDVARLLKDDDARRTHILRHVGDALKVLDLRRPNLERFALSLSAAEAIADRIYAKSDADAPTIIATGHTHIDVAWLWRVRETRQKMARSMATALSLMEEYPDYRFMYNQGLLLDYLAADYPELFARIRDRQHAGQFEIEGALWLEPDVSITGGEALVRHILHGVRYHKATFGVTPRIVWLPDTFGYSAALPQLMALAGLDMFVTHKLSWNDTNRMPHEVFHWQGIDGTGVPAYFLTTQKYEYDGINTTYCPDLVPSHVLGAWKRFSQKETLNELLLVYGHGDGGGGPTRAMIENVRRMERGIPGCPRLRHDSMGPFFSRLAERMRTEPAEFPTWVGELYLEYHRGTLTSVAKNKRNNRLAENVLREIELLAVLARDCSVPWPRERLWDLWQIVLLNQFHDILPGSSIGAVYDDSDQDYARFFADAEALRRELAAPLASAGKPLVLNATSRPRGGLVALPDGARGIADGNEVILGQETAAADGSRTRVVPVAAVPPMGGRHVVLLADPPESPTVSGISVSTRHLENTRLRVDFDRNGHIVSLVDKLIGRNAIAPGEVANVLVAHRDIPIDFDAWDIDASFEDKCWLIDDFGGAEVVETGPYRAAIRLRWRYERSTITQVLSLDTDSALLEVDNFINWHEHQTLLKVAFPLAVRSDATTAEIHFGQVRRPNHRNTSWDQARFETSMHRWVDMSEPGFGVALLNDCKYGYDANANVVRLTLIKSPIYPWADADQGEHRFRYGVLPHAGDLKVVRDTAEAFNLPLRLLAGGGSSPPLPLSFLEVVGGTAYVESVKPAEDGDGVIVRLFEGLGTRQSVEIRFSREWSRIARTDLLERPLEWMGDNIDHVHVHLAPFEVLTLFLEREVKSADAQVATAASSS